jgi:hypothetical protein
MRLHHRFSPRVSKGIVVALLWALSVAVMALIIEGRRSSAAAQMDAKLDASIFTYDGKDFVRSNTTLMTEDGKSAANTKLDHGSPAFKALASKHSYSGDATVFGHSYDANYAPLTDKDGKVTGALFVGVAK